MWYRSVFNKYSYCRDLFFFGTASRICDCHCHVWVSYFDTTKITVWCMSSMLIHMTYFSFYTICISEHYRVIVSYIPTPIQQVSAILLNITITVWLLSQVHCVAFFLMHGIFTSKNIGTNYTVIILSYRACSSEPQVVPRN